MSSQIRFRTWLKRRKATIQSLRELADKMDSMQKATDYTKLAGTTTAVASGLGVVCYILSVPFTGAFSLSGLATLGLVGGVLNLGTAVGNHHIEKELLEKTQKTLNADREAYRKLKLTNPDNSGRESELYRCIKLKASAVKELETTKKPPPDAEKNGGISTSIAAANPDDLEENITSLIKQCGSLNESAKMVRIIADELEEKMKHNELMAKENTDIADGLFTFGALKI